MSSIDIAAEIVGNEQILYMFTIKNLKYIEEKDSHFPVKQGHFV